MRARFCLLLALASACSDSAAPRLAPDAGPRSTRRVKPRPDDVRVYPPYAIRADGVGPYLLGAPLADVLRKLPEGPHVELLQIGELLSWRVVRAEEGGLLIGADEHNRVSFIAVLSPDVARTDAGHTVGTPAAKLVESLGAPNRPGRVVRLRRQLEFEKLPNVSFITDSSPGASLEVARIAAVLVARPREGPGVDAPAVAVADAGPGAGPNAGAARADCRGGGGLANVPAGELWLAAHPGLKNPPATAPSVSWGCVSGDSPEALLRLGDDLALVGGEPGKLKRLWVATLAAADVLAPLDVDGDGRDELVALSEQHEERSLSVGLRVWRWEAGKLTPVAAGRPIVVSRDDAAAAGASLSAVELWTEVWPQGDGLWVGGLYAARTHGGGRVVAPLRPVRVRVDAPSRPPPPPPSPPGADAGTMRDAAPP